MRVLLVYSHGFFLASFAARVLVPSQIELAEVAESASGLFISYFEVGSYIEKEIRQIRNQIRSRRIRFQ